ncbi:probable LRR receptor-like serine/threonine-protein kinase At3g47570 [Dioscorea cayenensis subsp. rotundata]|uniref:Receptor kinase-like protein Xa21 n=1 Tax=Dioscorea cayennensis subsp. rotundata TaxID=55577 RepID=A0AB40CXE4_DIOCR|nr:probable LRR receptor-like serine/threonine-protein kinase At3g47570 [Dioscorea cayenensis subsp. rotundata]
MPDLLDDFDFTTVEQPKGTRRSERPKNLPQDCINHIRMLERKRPASAKGLVETSFEVLELNLRRWPYPGLTLVETRQEMEMLDIAKESCGLTLVETRQELALFKNLGKIYYFSYLRCFLDLQPLGLLEGANSTFYEEDVKGKLDDSMKTIRHILEFLGRRINAASGDPSVKEISLINHTTQLVVMAMGFSRLLFFYLVLCSMATILLAHKIDDRLALLGFKKGVTSDPSGALDSWNDTVYFCNWTGVSCSHKHKGRVTAINLAMLGLGGLISPSIANLSFLNIIELSSNQFSGEVPPEFGRLHRLQYLNLSFNDLHGIIPESLANSSKLRLLELSFNHLNGSIPVELGGTLLKLKVLGLSHNSLSGAIPSSIGNLSSLARLYLANNLLRGIIPEELGRLSNLIFFLVGGNLLHGTIPSVLFNISSLNIISIPGNHIHGRLPSSFGNKLPKLTTLQFGDNMFSGAIPASLFNASLLEMIDISRNQFSGTVPPIFGGMHGLYHLNLELNQFQASDARDWSFIDSLVNCSNLYGLSIASNDLGGVLPLSVANFSKEMRFLYMDYNHFSGTIPHGIEDLINLIILHLGANQLTGPIPEHIGKLTMLQVLSLKDNKLAGYIPSSIGNLTVLYYIDLSGNRFEGTIPSTMKTLKQLTKLLLSKNKLSGRMAGEILGQFFPLQVLDLANNSFNGTIPFEIGSLINLQQLQLSGNRLTGEIPGTISGCAVLEDLNLQGNLITGSIPPSLGKLKGLKNLNLSHNSLSGGIPSSFSNLKLLQTLGLSNNNLSGSVPEFLQDLKNLLFLDLSYNHFHGELPVKGVFANSSALFLVGNVELCGGVPQLHLPVCLKSHKKTSRGSLILKIVIPIVSLLSCLLLLLLFLFLFRQRESKTKTKTSSSLPVPYEEFPRVSYYDLVRATDGFTPSNLIGKGKHASVYKGTLHGINNTMMMVAIKVFSLDIKGASKSFLSEMESLRNIRHRNLIKIITSCVSVDSQGNDFKALVLDLMPNGSLDSWLHPAENPQQQQQNPLSLFQRLNVAIDVADALEYLHHSCQPPVVHCDLKPSNVLLDDDMNARVGDFGLAKILMNNNSNLWQSSTASTEIIKGTIGYVPPEYGFGSEVSTMGDVYSYGILVLELLTGKRPVDECFKDGMTMRKFVESYASLERIMEVMDPSMFSQEDDSIGYKRQKECVVSVSALGLACCVDSPNERLSMSHVSAQMRAVRNNYLCVGSTSS